MTRMEKWADLRSQLAEDSFNLQILQIILDIEKEADELKKMFN